MSGSGTAGCSQPTRATPPLTWLPQFPTATAPQPCFCIDPGPTTFRPVSHPYYGERDARNFDAQQDPRRYTPPRPQLAGRSGLSVDATTDDTHAHWLGGPIISPRQWDRARVAQAAGVSSFDVAALGCQEYHGYDDGYCPLTQDIIFRCGYRNHTGDAAVACYHDITLLHCKVLDLWVNTRTQQCGPFVERI